MDPRKSGRVVNDSSYALLEHPRVDYGRLSECDLTKKQNNQVHIRSTSRELGLKDAYISVNTRKVAVERLKGNKDGKKSKMSLPVWLARMQTARLSRQALDAEPPL